VGVRKILILTVRGYQAALSPLMGGACRFEPSCSNYMIEALTVHGAAKGLLIGLWRILRCHPFGRHGYDPVPPKGRWRPEIERFERIKTRR
jgi:putative membrane protein insertion efficiency factor